jgi:hypothetical protein
VVLGEHPLPALAGEEGVSRQKETLMKRKYWTWVGLAALAVILIAVVSVAQEPDCERPRRTPTPTCTPECPDCKPIVIVITPEPTVLPITQFWPLICVDPAAGEYPIRPVSEVQ